MNKSSSKLNAALYYALHYRIPTIQYAYITYSNLTMYVLEIRFSLLYLNLLHVVHDISVRPDISATFSHTFATIEDSVVVFLL